MVSINEKAVQKWGDVEPLIAGNDKIKVGFERDGQRLSAIFPSTYIDSIEHTLPPIVGGLQEDFPAMKAGLQIGDRITAIDSQKVENWSQLTEIIHASPEKQLTVEWLRNGQTLSAEITPRKEMLQGNTRVR